MKRNIKLKLDRVTLRELVSPTLAKIAGGDSQGTSEQGTYTPCSDGWVCISIRRAV